MEKPELIVNLWYVHDDQGMIYSLRGRLYVGFGSDDEKLERLRRLALTDYLIASPFPVPTRFHTTVVEDNSSQDFPVCHVNTVELRGGLEALFEEVLVELEKQLPAQTKLTIGQAPLLVITPLLGKDSGEIAPSFTGSRSF